MGLVVLRITKGCIRPTPAAGIRGTLICQELLFAVFAVSLSCFGGEGGLLSAKIANRAV